MKRLVALAAAALLLAPAAPACGKGKLRAVSVCGPELCNIVRGTRLVADLEGLIYMNSGHRIGPPGLEPFYGVDTVTSAGTPGAGEFFPQAGVLRWRPRSGEGRWLALPDRVAASLRTAGRGTGPYEPAVSQATVGGKVADDAAGYSRLFDDLHDAIPPSGETIPIVLRFRAVGRRPWPVRYRYEPSTDTLTSEGRALRVTDETASMIERDAGLAGSGAGTPRWALAGAVAAGLAAAALAARRVRRRPMR